MIKHVYLLRVHDRSDTDEIIRRIEQLRQEVPYMVSLEVGRDFRGDDNSADITEVCVFENMDDFRRFGAEPYHCRLREYISVRADGIKIDYEI